MPPDPPRPAPLDRPDLARRLDQQYLIGLVCMLALVAAFPIYRLGEPTRREAARRAMHAESMTMGAETFARHCVACHGADGRGGGVAPTLNSREFLRVTSDQQLVWLIAGGVPGSAMSAYAMDLGGPFTPQEIDRVVVYLRSMEADAPSVPAWRTGARSDAPHGARHQGARSPDENRTR